jgi:hypothetical protein
MTRLRARALFAVALVGALLTGCVATYDIRPSSASRIGFNGAPLGPAAGMAREVDDIAATGATWLRADLNWPTVEPKRGSFNWEPSDQLVLLAKNKHLNVLGLLSYSTSWAGTIPSDTDFGNYAGAMAHRYAPMGVHAWEIWNEANLRGPWPGAPDPVKYTSMLKAAYRAIHAADPHAIVVSTGLSPAPDQAGYGYRPATFLQKMYAAGAKGYFDAVGLHISMSPYPPTINQTWNLIYSASVEMYPMMKAFGDANKKIWATEAGYSTTTDANKGVSEAAQGLLLKQMLQIWLAKPFAGPAFVYMLRDAGTDRTNWFDNMGLLRRDYSPKPAYFGITSWLKSGR